MDYTEHLTSPLAYLAPDKTLEGLSATDAERHADGVPHSIAEIVAHMTFWADWFHARCAGTPVAMAASAAEGWPAGEPGSWPQLRTRFLERMRSLAEMPETSHATPIVPAIAFPPLATYSIGEALVHVAVHNSHHLGQVILLRQLLGTWPPPAGSYTW